MGPLVNILGAKMLRLPWAIGTGALLGWFSFSYLPLPLPVDIVLSILVMLAEVFDPKPLRPKIQRAFFATVITAASYWVIQPAGGLKIASAVTGGVLWLYLIIDFSAQTAIQFIERIIEPSLGYWALEFKIFGPILNVTWVIIVCVGWLLAFILNLTRSIANNTPFLSPQAPQWERPGSQDIAFLEYAKLADLLRKQLEMSRPLEVVKENKDDKISNLFKTKVASVFNQIIALIYRQVYVLITCWKVLWNFDNSMIAIGQGFLKGVSSLGAQVSKATWETGICAIVYFFWYKSSTVHPKEVVEFGLYSVIQQGGYYTVRQFQNRVLEGYVVALLTPGLLIRVRKLMGAIFRNSLGFGTTALIKGSEFLTEEEVSNVQKQILLLPPAKDIGNGTEDDAQSTNPE